MAAFGSTGDFFCIVVDDATGGFAAPGAGFPRPAPGNNEGSRLGDTLPPDPLPPGTALNPLVPEGVAQSQCWLIDQCGRGGLANATAAIYRSKISDGIGKALQLQSTQASTDFASPQEVCMPCLCTTSMARTAVLFTCLAVLTRQKPFCCKSVGVCHYLANQSCSRCCSQDGSTVGQERRCLVAHLAPGARGPRQDPAAPSKSQRLSKKRLVLEPHRRGPWPCAARNLPAASS
jgi:hypothetical protein